MVRMALLLLLTLGAAAALRVHVADADNPSAGCCIRRSPTSAFLVPPAAAPVQAAPPRHRLHGRKSSRLYSSETLADGAAPTTTAAAGSPLSWDRLAELVQAALASEGDGIQDGQIDRSAVGGISPADAALVEALEGMKAGAGGASGAQGEGLRFFNSVRLEPYRVGEYGYIYLLCAVTY